VLEPIIVHHIFEQLSHVIVIRFLFEFEGAAVVQIDSKLFRKASAEGFDCRRDLLLLDLLILVIFSLGLKPLPREAAFKEVDEDEADRLEVIPP